MENVKEKVKYYLALERRPGEYVYIDINRLDICNYEVNNDINFIDSFTCRFTENEIRESIARSNMVQTDFLSGNLRIVSNIGHNLPVLTKEIFEQVLGISSGTFEIGQSMKDRIYGKFNSVLIKCFNDEKYREHMLGKLKEALDNNEFDLVLRYIANLPYEKGRPLYFAINLDLQKLKETSIKKLEKLDEAA